MRLKRIISIIVMIAIMFSTLALISANADVIKIDGASLGVSYSGGWDASNTYSYVANDGSLVMTALDNSGYYPQLQAYKDLNGGDKLLAEAKKHSNSYIAWDIKANFSTGDTPQALVRLTTGNENWQGDFDNIIVSGTTYTYLMTVSSFESSGYDRLQFQLNNYQNYGNGLINAEVKISLPYVYVGSSSTTTTTSTKIPSTTTAKATTANTNVSAKLYGDCNSDGSINGKDVLNLRKYIVKLTNVINTEVSDLNSDGNINGKDVLLLRKYIIGLIDRFPILNTQSTSISTTTKATTTKSTTTTKTTTTTTKSTTTTTKTTTKTTTTTTTKNPSSSGGTTSNMRDITATALVGEMTVGINIGDTLDSVGSGVWQETSWGNPKITKQLIQSIKAAGFNTIRLPVTWRNNIDSNNQINESFLNRVQEVVDYIMNEGMYCIINTHHEQNWLNTNSSAMESRKVKFAAVWNQLANRFKNYNEHLIFEGYNEILKGEGDWSSPSSTDLANANALAQVFVNTVRATGGNNAIRVLIINTYGALANTTAINGLTMPTDTVANKLAVEIHTYDPQSFCFLNNSDDTWGTIADKNEIDNILIRVYNKFVSKGIPAIVGEFGAVNKNNTSARAAYCSYMVSQAKSKGIKCIYWDNGHTGVASDTDTYGLFNRSTGAQVHSEIINALVNAAK